MCPLQESTPSTFLSHIGLIAMNQGEYKYLKISKHKDSTDDWS